MLSHIIQKIKTASKEPGVYIFYKGKTPLYVGKASNLRNRLKNYLTVNDMKTEALHREADELKVLVLRSNIEALIIESKMIKELKPQLNVLWRDDKNYFYVEITADRFPRIFLTHQLTSPTSEYIGPFTDGNPLKVILRLLRKSFPYCTCKPHLRICLNSQIGNCPGYCCNKNSTATKKEISDYRKNISKIRNILTGKDRKFIHTLQDPYELLVLEKIWQHQPYLETENEYSYIKRAECYDNSHLSGKEAVGAMTAWKKDGGAWSADKNMWRKFKILGKYTEDDPRMMEEIVSRRLNHPEWTYPDLLIIDGGITQFRAALRAVKKIKDADSRIKVPKVISFAKPEQQIYGIKNNPIPITELPESFRKFILLADQNTHNFVIRYHRKVRAREFIDTGKHIG